MLTIEEASVDQELTHSVARMSRFADNFFMGFRDGRGEDGRYPIIPGTFARRQPGGEMEATPLGELYLVLEGAIARTETTLDAIKEKSPDMESLVRRLREIRFELEFIVTGTDK